jgi:hypothetical protein
MVTTDRLRYELDLYLKAIPDEVTIWGHFNDLANVVETYDSTLPDEERRFTVEDDIFDDPGIKKILSCDEGIGFASQARTAYFAAEALLVDRSKRAIPELERLYDEGKLRGTLLQHCREKGHAYAFAGQILKQRGLIDQARYAEMVELWEELPRTVFRERREEVVRGIIEAYDGLIGFLEHNGI